MSEPGATIRAMPGDLERMPTPVSLAAPGAGQAAVEAELLGRVRAELPAVGEPGEREQYGDPGVDQLGGVQSPAPPEGQGLRRQRLCVRRKALQAFTARSARSRQSSRWESPWASVQVKVTTAPVGRVLASVMLQVRSPGCRSLCL